FWRSTEAAFTRIKARAERAKSLIEQRRVRKISRLGLHCLIEMLRQMLRVLIDLITLAPVGIEHDGQKLWEAGPAITIFIGKIRSAEERFTARQKKNGQRPPATSCHRLVRAHIHL